MVKALNKGLALVAAVLIGGILSGEAVLAADYDVPVEVTLTTTLSVVPSTLDFATVDYTPAGGTIVLDASALTTTTVTPSAASGISISGTPLTGSIVINSLASFNVAATYADVDLTSISGASTLTVTDIGTYSGSALAITGGVEGTLYVGGMLTVPVDADDGDYTGNIVASLIFSAP